MFFASELRSVEIFLGIEKGSNSCWRVSFRSAATHMTTKANFVLYQYALEKIEESGLK